MRRVSRPVGPPALLTLADKVRELCDATQQETEAVADAYAVTVPPGFVPNRALDLTGPLTVAQVAGVLASLLLDLKARGTNAKQGNV